MALIAKIVDRLVGREAPARQPLAEPLAIPIARLEEGESAGSRQVRDVVVVGWLVRIVPARRRESVARGQREVGDENQNERSVPRYPSSLVNSGIGFGRGWPPGTG